jgi:hypothetical protein
MKMSIILSCFVSLLLGILVSCQNSELTDPPQTSKYLPNKTEDWHNKGRSKFHGIDSIWF